MGRVLTRTLRRVLPGDPPGVGPGLTHRESHHVCWGNVDRTDENLARWLDNPGAKMPDLGLSPEQIAALVAYLGTLE